MSRPRAVEQALELPELSADRAPPCQVEGTSPEQVLDVPGGFRLEEVAPAPPELAPLLGYLGVPLEAFERLEARYFDALGSRLRLVGALAPGASVGRASYADAVRAFQRARGLADDGIPGQDVCWELQRAWAEARALAVLRVDADRASGSEGYDRFHLRADAVDAYEAMRRDVRAAGGVVTSAGSIRALDAAVGAGRSATSMHYSGLALDLALDTGMNDPQRDPYVVVQDGRKWRLWCRSPSAPPRSLDAVVWRDGRTELQRVTVTAFDFTEVMERYGFARIGPRRDFPERYVCAEWWHFQYELALVPWLSQFGTELLAISAVGPTPYDEAHLSAFEAIWEGRKRLFQRLKDGWW